jgi:hypothetical protein
MERPTFNQDVIYEVEGGQWVPSGLLSEAIIAIAQAKCDGLDWHVRDDGLGWAWIPDEGNGLRDCYAPGCSRTIVPKPADFDFVAEQCGASSCDRCLAITLYDPAPDGY